jgi:hypothetical protein
MKTATLLALLPLASLAACVSDPVKKSKPGTMSVMTGAAGAAVDPSGSAGAGVADPTGAAGMGLVDPAGASGTAGGAPDPSGAAGAPPDPAGSAGSSGAAGDGAAGTGTAGAGSAAGASGAAGATAGDASAPDAAVEAAPPPPPPPITDPCDHRAWTFTPSVVCTTTCAAMPDSMKLPANAIDGNTATRYTTGITQGSKGPEVAILTFPKPVTLTGINLVSKNGDGPISYLVEWSTDGANFSFFNPSAAGAGSDNLTVTFPAATKALALRITQTGVKKTNWWSVHELTVAGCAAAP